MLDNGDCFVSSLTFCHWNLQIWSGSHNDEDDKQCQRKDNLSNQPEL